MSPNWQPSECCLFGHVLQNRVLWKSDSGAESRKGSVDSLACVQAEDALGRGGSRRVGVGGHRNKLAGEGRKRSASMVSCVDDM